VNPRILKPIPILLLSLVILSIVTPLVTTLLVKAEAGTIILSSSNLNPYKIVELDIRLPGVDVDRVPVRVLDETGTVIASFHAKKLATGRYIAYLGGENAGTPQNPKIDKLSETVDGTPYSYYKKLQPNQVGPYTTLTIEVLGYDVSVELPYQPVATSLALDRTTAPVRTDLQDKYTITLTIADQDLNFDPTAVDQPSSLYFSVNVKLIKKETTGQTIGPVPLTIASIKETSANSGVFTATITVSDIVSALGQNVKLDVGDLLIIEAGTTTFSKDYLLTDSKMLNAVYNYPEISISFNNQYLTITIKSPDDNIDPYSRDYLAGGAGTEPYVTITLGSTPYTIKPSDKKFYETGANTGVFVYKLKVRWGNSFSIDTANNIVYLKAGSYYFYVEVTYLDITNSTTYIAATPDVSVAKATVASVVLNVTDADLNNDPYSLEVLNAALEAKDGKTTGTILFTKRVGTNDVLLYKVEIRDSAGNLLLSGIDINTITYSPSFIEYDLNSNVFRLMLPASYKLNNVETQLFYPGKSYIIRIYDYTGTGSGSYVKTITVTISEIKVELDRSVYPINLDNDVMVYVTLYDDRLNKDTTAIDKPGDGVLMYYVYNPTTGKYINPTTGGWSDTKVEQPVTGLEETGPNTGVFTATITIDHSIMSPKFIGAQIVVYKVGEEQYKATAKFDVYQVAPGDLKVDRTEVPINGSIVVTVYDPDANVDSQDTDYVTVNVYVDGTLKTTYKLYETDVNTATFSRKISVSTLQQYGVKPGSTIKFEYVDKTPMRSPTAADFGTPVTVSVTVKVLSSTGTLEVPKNWIGPYEIITIKVVDPDLNLDPLRAEEAEVTVAIEGVAETKTLVLKETGVNTGVFTGNFSLGWFLKGDVYATPDVETVAEYIGKSVTVAYIDKADATGSRKVNTATLTIKAVDAEISVDKGAVNVGDTIVITIKNGDIAGNPRPEFRTVLVSSDTLPTGITFYASEVEPGVYQVKATVVSLNDWTPGAPQIPAKLGDRILIVYKDPIAADGTEKIFNKTISVGVYAVKPGVTEKVETLDVTTGQPVKPAVGKEVFLKVTVKNVDIVEHAMTAIVVVRDPNGVAVARYAATVTLAAGASTEISWGWTPIVSGDHTVEVYIVKSLTDRTLLSDVYSETISVG